MKVLIINDFYRGGGAEGVFRATVNLLKAQGHEVKAFWGNENPAKPNNFFSYLYNRTTEKRLLAFLIGFQPDVVHIHNYYHILTSSIFVALRKFKKENPTVKIILTVHDFHFICPSSHMMHYSRKRGFNIDIPVTIKKWIFKKIDRRGFKYSFVKKVLWFFEKWITKPTNVIDVIISPSQFLINTFKLSGIKNKMVCIRNPLESVFEKKIINQVKRDKFYVVYYGRLSVEKGLKEFFKFAISNKIKLKIDIYGDGEERSELESLLKNNLNICANFLGNIENSKLQRILPKYQVALIPSIGYENAPLSIAEAANSGLVIWGADNGGIREMCELCNVPHFLYNSSDEESFINSYRSLNSFMRGLNQWQINLKEVSPKTYLSRLISIYD